ncbi:MAG TPA: hypothetical protein ENH29_06690 [Bacteroidetes bacterium]|nr:hypothetical protein [Bacteroidota bacterium]
MNKDSPKIQIKDLKTNEEFFAVIELQKIIWRLRDNVDCIPNHIFKAVSEIGGMVLGAYCDDVLAGFLMAIVGHTEANGLFHHSHILGVHPEMKHGNIGYRLKMAHYNRARQKGIKKITWTFDPLLGPNANLNIAKLGGIVRDYKVDYYGDVPGESDLVSGIPSDRFWVEWFIQTKHVAERLERRHRHFDPTNFTGLTEVDRDEKGLQKITDFSKPEKNRVAIQIPDDFQMIFDRDLQLALDWRTKTRDIFLTCFKQNYTVVDFVRVTENGKRGNYYLLRKDLKIK